MTKIKRTLIAAIIAFTIFINAHKPSDHEQVSESPTVEQTPPVVLDVEVVSDEVATQEVEQPVVIEPVHIVEQAPPPKQEPTYQTYEATFYTAGCEGCTGITASGVDVRNTTHYKGYRVLAADRSVPFGTIMRITLEDGTVFDGIVQDRGGAIRGKRLDILVASKAEAYRLGRQKVSVEILN